MDGEWSGGGGPEVEDEFACAGVLRGSLNSLHASVERVFRVAFAIGPDDWSLGNNGQIWLKLRGQSGNVKAAKLFVKGLVNQEEQQEVSYPGVLHCIFCGARGLFMDSLTKSTSAHIVVGSTGFLLISGLAEPVVRAYSLITDLVERIEATQSRRPEAGDRGAGESLDSRRAFKTLVEKFEDKHILDLLVLPGSVKEILLELVQESGLGSGPALTGGGELRSLEDLDGCWEITPKLPEPSRTFDRWLDGTAAGSGMDSAAKDSSFQYLSTSAGGRGTAEGAEDNLMHSPQEVGEEQPEPAATPAAALLGDEQEAELQLSAGNKEFWLLLKFFTAMGYTEDVVKRVLARTGLQEASQILDLVQQEQDRSDQEEARKIRGEKNRPCETEHREEEEEMEVGRDEVTMSNGEGGATGRHLMEKGRAEDEDEGPEEDFVLGVVKKAAASCGYMEQEVAKVYSMLPDRSTHQLLLELQRETAALREGPREMDDVVLDKEGSKVTPSADKARELGLFVPAETRRSDDKPLQEENLTVAEFSKFHKPPSSQTQQVVPEVKGPPMPTYPSSPKHHQPVYWPAAAQNNVLTVKPKAFNSLKQALQNPPPPIFSRNDSSPTRARERPRPPPPPPPSSSSVVVTGEQRFLEGLQMPFDLQLTDKPGNPKVRTIIIDGSNVAMSHGLGHFFSCRGIALAVQHFWDRGHRHISALLPQWRQKSDPKIKEQHYLTELQRLGLLSFTPSREVQGKRISSYDDRFMLQLAQKTDGVIVTNDNLRDLSDESLVWRDIIKKRLLQYTFVGDHFMVPDDPLGRGGPHLDDFLRSEHRTPDPGNHSFAGVATTFPSSKAPPRSQTEVLNFRDRTPGGSRGRGHGRGHKQRQLGASGPQRSPEETAGLREQLSQVFPGQDNMVALVLQCHPAETDMNVLSDLILEQ